MTTAIRLPVVLPIAAAVTIGLFLMMRNLIAVDEVPIPEPVESEEFILSIVVDPIGIPEPEHNPEYTHVELPPVPEPTVRTDPAGSEEPGPGNYIPVEPLPRMGRGDIGPIIAEGEPQPVVRIGPVYPTIAISRGLEGQCTIIFDILPSGATANVRTLRCSNSSFARNSERAVLRWRYSPQIRNGQAILYEGVTTTLVYELTD